MRSEGDVGLSELRSQGTGARRQIRWEELDASGLPPDKRAVVGNTWRERMRQEHLAVGAFSLLTREVAEIGSEPIVLSLLARAAADEIRHAEVCRRMAVALLGPRVVPHAYRGLPRVPAHEGASNEERALLHVTEMCCLSESLTAVYFTEMIARATHPVAKVVVESLLEDEVDHSRAGWAYLASRARTKTLGQLSAALPSMLSRTVGRALGEMDRPDDDDPSMEAFGYLGNSAGSEIVRHALHEVILPGLGRLGVETGPAEQWAATARNGRSPSSS